MEEIDKDFLEPCWKCGGTGGDIYKYTTQEGSIKNLLKKGHYNRAVEHEKKLICSACNGTGKLDWISNTLRKDISYQGCSNSISSGYANGAGYFGGSAYGYTSPSGYANSAGYCGNASPAHPNAMVPSLQLPGEDIDG